MSATPPITSRSSSGLSIAAGAACRGVSCRRSGRYRCPRHCPVVSRAIGSVFRGRQPAGRKRKQRNQIGREAVTTPTRSEALPDVPAAADFVAGYEAGSWFCIAAPKETSTNVIEKLNMEVNAAFGNASIRARLSALGASVLPGSPTQFRRFIKEETENYAGVIRSAKITAK